MYPIFICELKYKRIPVYVKHKKVAGAYIIISKGTLHFKYVSKEQTKSFKLYNHNKICFLFLCLFIK